MMKVTHTHHFNLLLPTKPRNKQELLVSPVLSPCGFPPLTSCQQNIYSIHNLRGCASFPADPHPLIKSDSMHWMQTKPISSCVTQLILQISVFIIPEFRGELPSSVCHMIYSPLMLYTGQHTALSVIHESIFHS